MERVVRDPARKRDLHVELDADDYDARKAEAFFAGVHEKFPLVAVFFQEGQFFGGESLLALDDASLVARLAASPR